MKEWERQALELSRTPNRPSNRMIARIIGKPKSTVCDFLKRCETGSPVPPNRVLIFDIETSPNLALLFGIWKTNVMPHNIQAYSHVITWAAKWLGEKEVMTGSIAHERECLDDFENDKPILIKLKKLMDQASIIVGHNSDRYDIKYVNTRLLKHNLGPISPFRSVDTLKIAKRKFLFPHNSLDGILKYLDMPTKTKHEGFDMWVQCRNGNAKAWEKMLEYNINDVVILEDLYLRMNPYDHLSPTAGVQERSGKNCCAHCGSEDVKISDATYTTATCEYSVFKCGVCKGYSRSRTNARSRREMQNTLVRAK